MQDIVLSALTASGDVVYAWNLTDDTVEFFGDTGPLFGPAAISDGGALRARIHADDVPQHPATNARVVGRHFDCEYRLRRDDGEFCWVHDRGRIETIPGRDAVRMIGSLRVVTDRKSSEAGRRDAVTYDVLTGHFNRARTREAIDQAMLQARRYSQSGAFIVVGLDNYKTITETYAEAVRDQVILGTGSRLEDSVRATDVVGRIDQHCFGVVLNRCNEEGATIAAGKIIAALSASPVATNDGQVEVAVSAGIVMFPDAAKTPAAALKGAESAYLAAVSHGGGGFEIYREADRKHPHDSSPVEQGKALLDALRDRRVAFAYQPVVRSGDGSVAYHETLLRLIDADNGPFEAAALIPAAEQLGHARRIDRYVLQLAVADLTQDPSIRLAINISGYTATDRSWLRLLTSLVGGRPQIANRLTVEITETAKLHDFEEAFRLVTAVRKLGCRVALDDFGAGHTSFRQLKSLPVDVVKIDGSFIRGIAQNDANQRFLSILLSYTNAFGIETVAECVERPMDRDYLSTSGVTYLQGWLCGRPALDVPVAPTAASPAA
ncbi:MAG: EAL domain-containing protein [Rhodospirillaceae bacterium]|nr:EAL domain-containing protein [Rhodospirillaceae bacterium]MDD9926334.1 EAL domain-containing protein [Rhodospirillaceae bacterium]